MSDNNLPHISYGLDPPGSIVRIESEIRSISRLSSIEETLRRFGTNLRPERQINESNNGKNFFLNSTQEIIHIFKFEIIINTYYYRSAGCSSCNSCT